MFDKRVIRSDVEGRRDHVRERRHAERYARRHGYYWRPCLLCGTEHGGHEATGVLPMDDGTDMAICPWCTAERQRLAEQTLRELGKGAEIQTSRWGHAGVVYHRVGMAPFGVRQDGFIATPSPDANANPPAP